MLRKDKRLGARRPQGACDVELRQLRAFVALVDEGSVTAAARALKLSQSTVSETLAALERKLGTSVVRRRPGTHDTLLTPAGQALLPNARELLARVEQTYVAVVEAAAHARGAVDIVANESVSTYVLPRVLAGLRGRRPNTRFSVSVATCSDALRGIDDGVFDIGFILQAQKSAADRSITNQSHFEDRHVAVPTVPLIVFATPGHPLAEGKYRKQIAKSDLSEFAVFVSDPSGEFYELIDNFFSDAGMPMPRIRPAGSIEGVKRGVRGDTRAVGILPAYAIQEELRAGLVVRLDVSPAPPTVQLVAVLSLAQKPHPATMELIEDIRKLFSVPSQTA